MAWTRRKGAVGRLTLLSQPLPKIKIFSDEWAVLQFLKKWTPDDIGKAIDEDIDLADLMLKNWAATGLLRLIARRNSEGLRSFLSPENILGWFSCRRPDIHAKIVEKPNGQTYITNNFIKIRDLLNI